jgi:acyl-CoA hydrolase
VWETLDGLIDLGIHTEMFSDGAMRAIERGIVTGMRKTLHPGKVIITFALKVGTKSRITTYLVHGAGVVTTRADVHHVVTEHDVANLFGKKLREQAEALIAIADSRFREELEREAWQRRLLS